MAIPINEGTAGRNRIQHSIDPIKTAIIPVPKPLIKLDEGLYSWYIGPNKLTRALIGYMKFATELTHRSSATVLIDNVDEALASEKLSLRGNNRCKGKRKAKKKNVSGDIPHW